MSNAGNLPLNTAILTFCKDCFDVMSYYLHERARKFSLNTTLGGRHLGWQVTSATQVFHTLGGGAS